MGAAAAITVVASAPIAIGAERGEEAGEEAGLQTSRALQSERSAAFAF
eukprot:COSAG04_NODE_21298_length_376_cov_0.823105_1_plen_47_part_01